MKQCSCGFEYHKIPEFAFYFTADTGLLSGWYWNCEACQSTLFVPKSSELAKVSVPIFLWRACFAAESRTGSPRRARQAKSV